MHKPSCKVQVVRLLPQCDIFTILSEHIFDRIEFQKEIKLFKNTIIILVGDIAPKFKTTC